LLLPAGTVRQAESPQQEIGRKMQNLFWIVFAGWLLIMLVLVAAFASLFRLWLRCHLSGAPVSLPQILMMKLRRSDAQLICEQRIKAAQAGTDLSPGQLERAHLQGADIEKLAETMLHARRTGREVTWEQL